MADETKPFSVDQDVAASENAEFLRAQVQFLQNRTFVLRQLLVNAETERDALKEELAHWKAGTSDVAVTQAAPDKPEALN